MPPPLILALGLVFAVDLIGLQEPTPPPLVADEIRKPLRGSGEAAVVEPETASDKPLVSTGKMERLRTVDGVDRFRFGGIVPDGFHLVAQMTLANIGLATFLLAYLPLGVVAVLNQEPALLIPFAGPIAAFRPSSGLTLSGAFNALVVGAIMMDVLAQMGGMTMLIAGLATPKRWLERDVARPRVSFVPGAPGAALGASLVGRY